MDERSAPPPRGRPRPVAGEGGEPNTVLRTVPGPLASSAQGQAATTLTQGANGLDRFYSGTDPLPDRALPIARRPATGARATSLTTDDGAAFTRDEIGLAQVNLRRPARELRPHPPSRDEASSPTQNRPPRPRAAVRTSTSIGKLLIRLVRTEGPGDDQAADPAPARSAVAPPPVACSGASQAVSRDAE